MAEEEATVEAALEPVVTTNTKKKARKKKVKKTVVEIEAPIDDQYIQSNTRPAKSQKPKASRLPQRHKSRSPSPQPSLPSSALPVSESAEAAVVNPETANSSKDEDFTGSSTLASQDVDDNEGQFSSPPINSVDIINNEQTSFSPPLPLPVASTTEEDKESNSNDNSSVNPSKSDVKTSGSESPKKETKHLSFAKSDFTVKISPEDALAKIKKDIVFITRELQGTSSVSSNDDTISLCLGEVDTLLSIVGLGLAESAQKVYDLSVGVNKMASENKRLSQELSAANARIAELEARPLPPLPEEDFSKLKECEANLAECLQVVRPREIIEKPHTDDVISNSGGGAAAAGARLGSVLEFSRRLVGSCSEVMTSLSRNEMILCQMKGDLRDAQESYFFSLALSIKQNLMSSNAAKGAVFCNVPELFEVATRLKVPCSEWPKWISDNLINK